MGLPTNPVDGQIYNSKVYISSTGTWEDIYTPPVGTIYSQSITDCIPSDKYIGTWEDITEEYIKNIVIADIKTVKHTIKLSSSGKEITTTNTSNNIIGDGNKYWKRTS
jgi:hypothetical protein